jgi:hypothetical protein
MEVIKGIVSSYLGWGKSDRVDGEEFAISDELPKRK